MTSAKKSTSMTLDRVLLDEARQLGVNISKAAESGIVSAIRAERARRWKEENAEAIAEHNARIAAEGLPLSEFRMF